MHIITVLNGIIKCCYSTTKNYWKCSLNNSTSVLMVFELIKSFFKKMSKLIIYAFFCSLLIIRALLHICYMIMASASISNALESLHDKNAMSTLTLCVLCITNLVKVHSYRSLRLPWLVFGLQCTAKQEVESNQHDQSH